MLVESVYHRKCEHPVLYVVIILLCLGPIFTRLGSSKWDGSPFGIFMMCIAVVGGGFKYVLAHAAIKSYRHELGTLAFTFWVEIFVGTMLLPWAVLNGEAAQLFTHDYSVANWLLLWGTAAFGGVRIYSQFAFLKETSATTLAMSNLTIQAFTIILGIVLFGTPLTFFLGLGVTFTLAMSAVYTYLKVTKVLQKKPPPAPIAEKLEMAEADGAEGRDSAYKL